MSEAKIREQSIEAVFREARAFAGPTVGHGDARSRFSAALCTMMERASEDPARLLAIAAAAKALFTGGRSDAELRALDEVAAEDVARREAEHVAKLAEIYGPRSEEGAAAIADARRLFVERRAKMCRLVAAQREARREQRRAFAEFFGEDTLRSPEWGAMVAYSVQAIAKSLN